VLKQHVAALYLNMPTSSANATEIGDGIAELSRDDKALFQEVVQLKFAFLSNSYSRSSGSKNQKTEGGYIKFKTRQRVTADGVRSRLAAEVQF
jgi:hypothetical protein